MEDVQMIRKIISWLLGPITSIAGSYIEARANIELKKNEREAQKDVLTAKLQQAAIRDRAQHDKLIKAVLTEDRQVSATSWIRPVTVGLALVFWTIVALTQMRYNGNPVLPITLTVPPGRYGDLLFYLPFGVIGTFTVMRPFEKMAMVIKGK